MRHLTLTLHDQNMMAARHPSPGDVILLEQPAQLKHGPVPPMRVIAHLSISAFSERYDGIMLFTGRAEQAATLDAHRGWVLLGRVPTPLNGSFLRDARLFCSLVDVVEAMG